MVAKSIPAPSGSRTERIYESWQVTEEVWEASSGLRERRRERVDGLGQLAAVDEWEHPMSPAPFTTSYLYDPFGQLAVVRDPAANDPALCNGHTASPACAGQSHEQRLFYDQVGNRIRLEDPDGGISAWAYDGAGLVAQQWRGNGQSHTFTYDAFGRMQRIHPVNPPTPEADIVFTYGAATAPNPTVRGRLIRVDDDEGFELFGYDAAGNLAGHTRTVGGKRFSFFHVSDPLGRRQRTTYPDGEVATWHYDKALLARISSASGSYDGDYLSSATYDALDRPTFLGAGGGSGSNPVALQGGSTTPSPASSTARSRCARATSGRSRTSTTRSTASGG